MFIGARDHARIGQLVARRGAWGGRQLLPADWIGAMLEPSPTNASYGLCWWLNRGAARQTCAPESSVYAMGAGNNIIWVDRDNDLVVVLRWIDKTRFGGFMTALMAAVK